MLATESLGAVISVLCMRPVRAVPLCFALLACAASPVLPRQRQKSNYDRVEFIAYRALTRDDFRATTAVGFTIGEEHQLAATTCARIVARPAEVSTLGVRSTGGLIYTATLQNPLFFAGFDRNCSFWSAHGAKAEEEVLEHEQVHFAIVEIEARRLNSQAADIERRVHASGMDLAAVRQRAQAEATLIMKTASDATMARHRRFDEATFHGGRAVQQQWSRTVLAELETMRHHARGPQVSMAAKASATPDAEVVVAPPASPTAPASSSVPSLSFPSE